MAGRKILGSLAAAALAVSLMLGGCGSGDHKDDAPQAAYGIADLETLVKAHPSYSEYFRLQKEYEDLLARYRAEQRQLFHLSETQKTIQTALASADAQRAAEEEFRARVKIKEDALNQKLRDLYEDIDARRAAHPARPELAGGDAEDNTQIANLHLKLKILRVGGEEKQAAEAELKDLLNSRYGEIPQDGWTEEEKKEFSAARSEAKAELDAFAAQTAAEIRERRQQSMAAASAPALPDADSWNSRWEGRVKEKQQEMADVKSRIMDDIRDKAAVIGEKKHLAMIFTSYRANVDAEDVTGDIAGELVNIK